MKSHVGATLVAALALAVPVSLGISQAQDPHEGKKKSDKPETPKHEKRPMLEDAIARAFRTAKQKVDDEAMVRSTVVKGMHDGDETYVVIFEFESGDIGIFEGALDPQSDQWGVVTKGYLPIVDEIVKRGEGR